MFKNLSSYLPTPNKKKNIISITVKVLSRNKEHELNYMYLYIRSIYKCILRLLL